MQRLDVSGAVRPVYVSLGVKRLIVWDQLLYSPSVSVGALCHWPSCRLQFVSWSSLNLRPLKFCFGAGSR